VIWNGVQQPSGGTFCLTVLLELRSENAMSEDVLDANSDAVLEAVQRYGSDIALGPTISLNLRDFAIRLRFDVMAKSGC
jgi:hypothetical protein